MTTADINRIHTRGLATEGRKYYSDDGEVYIGTANKRLRLLDRASETRFKPTSTLNSTNVQKGIERIEEKINNLPITSEDNAVTYAISFGGIL